MPFQSKVAFVSGLDGFANRMPQPQCQEHECQSIDRQETLSTTQPRAQEHKRERETEHKREAKTGGVAARRLFGRAIPKMTGLGSYAFRLRSFSTYIAPNPCPLPEISKRPFRRSRKAQSQRFESGWKPKARDRQRIE